MHARPSGDADSRPTTCQKSCIKGGVVNVQAHHHQTPSAVYINIVYFCFILTIIIIILLVVIICRNTNMNEKHTYYYLKSTGISKHDVDLMAHRMFYYQTSRQRGISPVYYWIEQVGGKFRLHAFIRNVTGGDFERMIWTIIVELSDGWQPAVSKKPKLLSLEEVKTLTSALSHAYPKRLKMLPAPQENLPNNVNVLHCNYFKDMLSHQ